ncbi:DUF5658 family protein [Chloroflexota bacterium]
MRQRKNMGYILGLLVVFVVSDGLLTNYLVNSGFAREGNPLLQPLVGDVGFLVLKFVGALVCALILWDVSRRYRRLALVVTSCGVLFYATIILWNLGVFVLVGLNPG